MVFAVIGTSFAVFSHRSNFVRTQTSEKGLAGRGGMQAAHLISSIDDETQRMTRLEHQKIGGAGFAGLGERNRFVDGVSHLAQQQFGAQQHRVVLAKWSSQD